MDNSEKLFQAVMDGDGQSIQRMIEQDPGLVNARTPSGVAALLFALYYGQPAVARMLLLRGAQLDVFSAAALGAVESLRKLLAGAPGLANAVAADGYSPLGLAAYFGQVEAVRLLIAAGADVNRPARNHPAPTPLHSAAAGQHLEVARLLLEAGADINASEEGGFTALMAAAQNGDVNLTRLLLERGADRAITTQDGLTAYMIADGGPSSAVAALFIQK